MACQPHLPSAACRAMNDFYVIGLGLVWLLGPERNTYHPVCIQRLTLLGRELGLTSESQAGGKEAGTEKGYSLEDGTSCLPEVWSVSLSQLEHGWAYPEQGQTGIIQVILVQGGQTCWPEYTKKEVVVQLSTR